jgi:hypothetical protein
MTGPEHYREAEALVLAAFDIGEIGSKLNDASRQFTVAAAQVHATLALAAATAAEQAMAYDGDENHARSRGWSGVV